MVVRRPAALPSGVGGFTLIEMVIAAILGLFVTVMALSVLQIQGELQTRVTESVARQTVVDFAAGTVSDELRPVTGAALTYAGPDSVVFRRPLLFGQFCGLVGSNSYLYLPLEGQALPAAQVAGIGIRDTDGNWQNYDMAWSSMGIALSQTHAAPCAANGADTVRISRDFGMLPVQVQPGLVFSLYTVRRITLGTSLLDPSVRGIFVGGTGDTTREMTSGLAVGTTFQYRHEDGRLLTTPSTAELPFIQAVRFTAVSILTVRPGAPRESWTVEVRLQNAS
jgi:type II secretory pathway pseudopilin PulG